MQIAGARSPLCRAFQTDGFWGLIRVRKTSLSMRRINIVISIVIIIVISVAIITNMEKSTDNADHSVQLFWSGANFSRFFR